MTSLIADAPAGDGRAAPVRRMPYAAGLDGLRAIAVMAVLLYHGEVIHRDGQAVGYVRAASYGFTLGGAVGLAMIEAGDRHGAADAMRAHLSGTIGRLPDIVEAHRDYFT